MSSVRGTGRGGRGGCTGHWVPGSDGPRAERTLGDVYAKEEEPHRKGGGGVMEGWGSGNSESTRRNPSWRDGGSEVPSSEVRGHRRLEDSTPVTVTSSLKDSTLI